MKKKNKRELELDEKEFEKELHRDLHGEYQKLKNDELLLKNKNKYVIAAINFFTTLLFFEVFYWLIKVNTNYFTLGFSQGFFEKIGPFFHLAVLILSISAVINKKSAVEVVIDKWPF